MEIKHAINQLQYRIDTASQIVGKGKDGKAYEDMEMAIKALQMQMEIQECISNNICIDIQKLTDVVEKYLMQ